MAIEVQKTLAETRGRNLYLPNRGVIVELPPTCSKDITVCPQTGDVTVGPMEKIRLRMILDDAILEGRYPARHQGEEFMDEISPQWRDRLLEEAGTVAEEIKRACWSVGKEEFAVILFGSVAKNLVKNRIHDDPSNIDLAVIGDFTYAEKLELLDIIRPARQQMTAKIRAAEFCRCQGIRCYCQQETVRNYSQDANAIFRDGYGDLSENVSTGSLLIERVCIIVQTPETICSSGYGVVRAYISSAARAVYDPANLWERLENEALAYMHLTPAVRRKIRRGRLAGESLESIYGSWNGSKRFQADRDVLNRMITSLQQNP